MGYHLTDSDREKAVSLFVGQKKKLCEIAGELGFSYVAIRMALKKKGVYELRDSSALHRKYKLNEHAFDTITDESAYWVGFLMADGYVLHSGGVANSVGLCLHERDREHVSLFRSFVGSTHPIRVKKINKKTKGGRSCSVYFRSKKMAHALGKYGVVPNKSLTATVSDSLAQNRHFWRGVIDGDGAVTIDACGMPNLSVVGSHTLMRQFVTFITGRITYTPYIEPSKRSKVLYVRTCGEGAKQIATLLYDDCSVSLMRKRKTTEMFKNTKEYRIFSPEARINMKAAAKKVWAKRKAAASLLTPS